MHTPIKSVFAGLVALVLVTAAQALEVLVGPAPDVQQLRAPGIQVLQQRVAEAGFECGALHGVIGGFGAEHERPPTAQCGQHAPLVEARTVTNQQHRARREIPQNREQTARSDFARRTCATRLDT